MLSVDTRQFLQSALARMVSPVRLVLHGEGRAGIARELSFLSDRITVEEPSLVPSRDASTPHRLPRAPAIAVVSDRDRGIRFLGTPGGYEIMALADAILLVSSGDSGLSPVSRARLAALTQPIDLDVFVTPT